MAAFAACILAMWTGASHAQTSEAGPAGAASPGDPLRPVGSVGAAESAFPSHGWVAVPAVEGDHTITHIPPRDVASRAGPAPAGGVRAARPVRELPEALAALGERLYAVFPPDDSPMGPIRRVFVSRAFASGLPGVWADSPSGAFDLGPSLPGGGELMGLGVSAGRNSTIYALLTTDGAPALLRMEDNAWQPVALPVDLPADPNAVALVSFGPGVMLAARAASGGSRAWSLAPGASWTATPLADWDLFWRAAWRRGYGQEIVVGVPDAGSGLDPVLGVWGIGATNSWRIASVASADGHAAPAVLASSDRLVLVGRDAENAVRASEFSLVTGRSMFDGEAQRPSGVPSIEFRMIALMLIAVMVASILVIIRPVPEEAWTVPDGFALADPSRRLLATVADALLVIWVVAPAFGTTVQEILTLQVLLQPDHSWLAVPACMIAGALTMGVWEGLLGGSPGKFIVGIRVYRAVDGEARKIGVFWGLVRSTIKWAIPPVTAVALFDAQHRHRGDAAARAVVVVPVRPGEQDA
jgi:hypothetical protein